MAETVECRVLLAREREPARWRNGGGVTWEVAAGAQPGERDFDWRISVAEVSAPGPFSAYPGIDRIIALIEGVGLELTVDSTEHVLGRYEPFRFRGDDEVYGRPVGGSTKDLNVMVRRDRFSAALDVVDLAAGDVLDHRDMTGTSVLLLLAGRAEAVADEDRHDLAALDGLLAAGHPVRLVAQSPSVLAVIVLQAV